MVDRIKLEAIPKDLLFALDIGTRNVVGVISRKKEENYEIIDVVMEAHPERAMFDGQIHDIAKVTGVVKKVVDRLEKRSGYKLERAAIAAAGRALKTEKNTIEREVDITKSIDKSVTDGIEMEAIQEAQKILADKDNVISTYYCVGHSVISYTLDGAMILNPIGHRGGKLGVEIIATFLPHIVVDSLYSVISNAGLEVMNLTLEPIAAMNVTIPQNLRLLNLALIDVGAGTSDIAISMDGTVHSYGMVSIAGDEITEKLAKHYLLDFNMAEKLKIGILKKEESVFTDILGIEHKVSKEELMEIIEPSVEKVTSMIAESIMELNVKVPSAIFCIGGGSQIPFFTEKISEKLGLDKQRTVMKKAENLEKISYLCDPLEGPEFITPIGIGITAFEERGDDFVQVSVNETSIRLFNSKELVVSDALIIAGFNARSLISERGDSYFVELDGEKHEIKGHFGEAAKIFINGKLSSLDTKILNKDNILIERAEKGRPREASLNEVVNYREKITFHGQEVKMIEYVKVNGVSRTGDYKVQQGDVIETLGMKTVNDLVKISELDLEYFVIVKDDIVVSDEEVLISNGIYGYRRRRDDDYKEDAENYKEIESYEEEKKLAGKTYHLTVNKAEITIRILKECFLIADIFDHIDFDISKSKGLICITRNNQRVNYLDEIFDGDTIDIEWK